MTVILPQYRLAYFAVPKVACTTIKSALFQAGSAIDLSHLSISGPPYPIHRICPTRRFNEVKPHQVEGFQQFAVVRDPIERFLSAYRNRVLEKDEIRQSRPFARLRERGLPLRPDLSTFIAHLEDYKSARAIEHNVAPLTTFLGRDPSYFTEIYDISRVGELLERLGRITGRAAAETVQNSSSQHRGQRDSLSEAERRVLEDLYAEDYQIFGHLFAKDRGGA